MTTAAEIVAFWTDPEIRAKWFVKDADLDLEIRTRFLDAMERAGRGELEDWRRTAEGVLALLILLDQFSRNVHRGDARAFAQDARAREIARHAVAQRLDLQVLIELRLFFYLPFEHSEEHADQLWSVALFAAMGNDGYLDYAQRHLDVIARFGRFPHRNTALSRPSTPDEKAYLADPNAGF